ncbi:MAG: class I SAM-dependent methyltransferase, partial [Deltaproteobacteria bacterium]|nr:class I SAM-dependent methyltransferase [Deltaproteobacteria bacterium]
MKVHHNQELPYANSPEEKRREAEIFSKHYYTRDTLEWWISHPYRRHTLRHLTRYLRVRSDLFRDNCRVIEPACGCGVNLTNLAKDFPHYEYFGLDLSLQGVRVASTWGGGCYAVGDAEDIPFGGETFDICLCIAAIHHFHRNPTRFLGEMCRVVKRNGV